MKGHLQWLRFAGSFMALLSAGWLSAQVMQEPDPCILEVRLLAGQHMDIGIVRVESSSTEICVSYILSQEALAEGWLIYETHLAIGLLLSDIPQTRPNRHGTNPIPGHFPYKQEFVQGVESWTECVDLEELGAVVGDIVYIAAHAVVVKAVEDYYVGETAWGEGYRFNTQGNWGMYLMYEICEDIVIPPIELSAYIGYEDRLDSSDYDYDDFGMDFILVETYNENGVLEKIIMEFYARYNLAGDVHDIHIVRQLQGAYTYSVTRSEARYSSREVDTVVDAFGSGIFDVVLFDTARWENSALQVMGQSVTIVITMDPDNNANTFSDFSVAPRWDLENLEVGYLFSLYNPKMVNRTMGYEIHIDDEFMVTSKLPLTGYEVPHILVIPVSGWEPPGEGIAITGPYPYFDDYYSTQDVNLKNWWQPGFTP